MSIRTVQEKGTPRTFTVTLEKQLTNGYGLNTASFLSRAATEKKKITGGSKWYLFQAVLQNICENTWEFNEKPEVRTGW
jgi:hypothetical protein